MFKKKKKLTALEMATKAEPYLVIVWRNFRRNIPATIALGVIIVFILAAIFAPYLAPYDPYEMHMEDVQYGIPAPPSEKYILGTDNLGRDVLSRVIYGGRISLTVAFMSTAITLLIGIPVGCVMGYYGGKTDFIVSRIIEFLNTVPTMFLLMIVNSMLPKSIFTVGVILGVFGWTGIARQLRGQIFAVKNEDFVQAAIALGYNEKRIMFRHILPHAIMPTIVSTSAAIGGFIVTESGLSYLGFGTQEPMASWGSMLTTAQKFMRTSPSMAIVTGVLMSICVICFNFIGDALRNAINPRSIQR